MTSENQDKAEPVGVTVYDGKYTVQCDGEGRMRCLRYGKPWRDLTGDGMVLALVQEIQQLRSDLARKDAEILDEITAARAPGNALYATICDRIKRYFPAGTRDLEWDVLPGTIARMALDLAARK